MLDLDDATELTAPRCYGFSRGARARPLVHCMTNIVVAGFTANVLLAVGASPAMVENERGVGEFAAVADALLVNLGTLSGERVRAIRLAAVAAAGARYARGSWIRWPSGR